MAGIKFFGLGNFLGGMSEGFQQMAKIQQEKDRLALQQQALELQDKAIAQDAAQFAGNQQLARDTEAGRLGLAEKDMAQRERLAKDAQSFQYGLHMDEERQRGLDRLERRRGTDRDALSRIYIEDLATRLPEGQRQRLLSLLPPMMTAPQPTNGGPVLESVSPFQNFYKGGILGTLGQ